MPISVDDNEDAFDPLSFFTSEPSLQATKLTPSFLTHDDLKTVANVELDPCQDQEQEQEYEDEDEDLVDILDLPLMSQDPPYDVIMTILQLLTSTEENNFGSSAQTSDKFESATPQDVFSSKKITDEQVDTTLKWMKFHMSTITTESKLCSISLLINRKSELIQYLTKVIASPLTHLSKNLNQQEQIWTHASLIISNLSGRWAKPDFTRKITTIPNIKEIKLHEPSITEDNLGLKTWGASLTMSQRLSHRHNELLKEPILELGAGTGLVGITIGLLGYQDVTLTDLPEIVGNMKANVELNELNTCDCNMGTTSHETSNGIKCGVLDWSKPEQFEGCPDAGYNTIILSDPIYSEKHPYWIQDVVKIMLSKSEDSRVLLQVPLRDRFGDIRQLLWNLLEEIELTEVESTLDEGLDDFGEQKFIFKIYKWKKSL
ncbi:unnamed protein product [Ambrosiozyma monospora]|uniref:Unnamed protein product n=1 Tax=Ambrosiozyma monospora TaxID=43982 RepID=A0A9W6YSR6_AMBMO|nr:unnamed protein product [Ambrosiozyma monospora]